MDSDFKKIKKFLFPDGLSHGLVHFGESIFLLGSLSPWSFLLGSLLLISRGQRLENLQSVFIAQQPLRVLTALLDAIRSCTGLHERPGLEGLVIPLAWSRRTFCASG